MEDQFIIVVTIFRDDYVWVSVLLFNVQNCLLDAPWNLVEPERIRLQK